jgi:hypothetical protein
MVLSLPLKLSHINGNQVANLRCPGLSIALHDIFYVFSKTPETDFVPVSYCLILSGKTKTPKCMQDKYLRKYFVHLKFYVDLNQQFLS